MITNKTFALALGTALSLHVVPASATDWTTTVTNSAGTGTLGTITFNDWGYTGPSGRQANDFSSINGFNGAAQIQHVVTTGPDGLTPDAPNDINVDLTDAGTFTNANMDSQVNFYRWGYTTTAGSTFSNMQIDADGDYLVHREDMNFAFYDTFDYVDTTGVNPSTTFDTNIDFQPYALSDATGWCGSVMASNPAALEAMAGQVSFDFGFEAFFPWSGGSTPGTGSMQIVKDFEMRSYGSLSIDVSVANGGTGDFHFEADAVVNNTNPENPLTAPKTVGGDGVDENYYNKVSFMGGGIVPDFVWILVVDDTAPMTADNIVAVLDVDSNGDPIIPAGMSGVLVHHQNSFAGYPFLLRADGLRILDAMDYSLYSDLSGVPASGFDGSGNLINLEGNVVADLSAVPVPAAVWLFGSGLIGLLGVARKKQG